MFAYRFLPRRKYVVEIREYACESCPGCKPTRDSTRRYHDCIHLQTVKAVSYKGRGHGKLLRSDRCVATGWVTHKIVPITTTATTGETLTLTPKLSLPPPPSYRYQSYGRVGTGGLPAPVGVRRSVTAGRQRIHGEYERWRVWGAKAETFLGRTVATPPLPGASSVVWKTRQALPPDVSSGSYCCKIQWFKRTSTDGRLFALASAQYISLSCIVPVDFKIVLREGNRVFQLDEEVEKKIMIKLNGLIIDD